MVETTPEGGGESGGHLVFPNAFSVCAIAFRPVTAPSGFSTVTVEKPDGDTVGLAGPG